ncbi:MAG: class I SAM-dependent methyltransferase [Candidatus Woesearchaeota archaeon]
MTDYYDSIAPGYDNLHKEEQLKKLNEIKDALGNSLPKKGDLLLDVGCGTGISTAFWNCTCTGIDPSEELIKIARENYPDRKFIVSKGEELPFPNNSFDFVVSITAIHNFDDVKQGIMELKRVGSDKFVITAFRKSAKLEEIQKLIIINFKVNKILMEDKDLIFICEKLQK